MENMKNRYSEAFKYLKSTHDADPTIKEVLEFLTYSQALS